MAPLCGICNVADSKYKCPTCELRYCSLKCYKPHKASHEAERPPQDKESPVQQVPPKPDRPGTTQRAPKLSFTDFEHDSDFQRLLKRYPTLKIQLQAIYALTLDPGPDEGRRWNRQPLPSLEAEKPPSGRARGNFRGRGGHSRGFRGGRQELSTDRQTGQWTKEKGDKEALTVIQRMSDESVEEARAEGMREFIELVRMRFGDRKEHVQDQ